MIDLYNGEFLDLLPVSWRRSDSDAYLTQEDIDSLSYALRWCTQTLVDAAKKTRTQSMIDDLPERILDILAVELRAPYYSQTLPLETKRTIIKSSVRWHMHAGTPSAVRELMQVVFGDGEVIENWDFDDGPGEPYTFDLITSAAIRPDSRPRLFEMLDRVKNVRSHLRYLIYVHPPVEVDITITATVHTLHSNYLPELDKRFDFERGPVVSAEGSTLFPQHLEQVDKRFDFERGPVVSAEGSTLFRQHMEQVDKMFDFERGPVVSAAGSTLFRQHMEHVDKDFDFEQGAAVDIRCHPMAETVLSERDKAADFAARVQAAVEASEIHTDHLPERDKAADYGRGIWMGMKGGTIAVQHLRNLED